MRTMDLLEPELNAYQKALSGLLKKHGARSSLAELREAVRLLEAKPDASGEESLAGLKRKIEALEPFERLEIGPGDSGWEAFQAERKELDARTVELFLDRKVEVPLEQLPGGATNQSLSAFDMRELAPLVEFE